MEELLKNGDWHIYDLYMTEDGFETFRNEVSALNEISPQVYIHVSDDDVLKNKVLRIGKAKNGVIDRWINQSSGHGSTFLWSIGKSIRYASYAKRYPNYLTFFAGLFELNTKLYVLNCESIEDMNQVEKDMIQHFSPLWENYKKPIRDYFNIHPAIKELMSTYGGAQNEIMRQRNNVSTSTELIPDVITFNNIDTKTWIYL